MHIRSVLAVCAVFRRCGISHGPMMHLHILYIIWLNHIHLPKGVAEATWGNNNAIMHYSPVLCATITVSEGEM